MLVTFIMASIAVSCSNSQQHSQIISDAKRIVDEHPDSAYVLLKKVDFNGLTDNESKALYALTHAKVNMYMGHSLVTDTIIPIAINYYKEKADTRPR